MNAAEIETKLRNILVHSMESASYDIEKLEADENLSNYNFDSVAFIKTIVNIEDEFLIEFEDEFLGIDKFATLNDIIKYISSRLASAAGTETKNEITEVKVNKEDIVTSIGYCGIICHFCNECNGCRSTEIPEEKLQCHNRQCCIENNINGCWECEKFPCDTKIFSNPQNVRLRAFVRFMQDNGPEGLADCLLENEKKGIKYGYGIGYDLKNSEEEVIELLKTGSKRP